MFLGHVSAALTGGRLAVCLFVCFIQHDRIFLVHVSAADTLTTYLDLRRLDTPHASYGMPYAICHMPKYAQIWLNMPYFGIWHMAYGHAIWGMLGVQALSRMYIDGL